MVTWDETKRQCNISKHQLDFKGCESIFDYPVVSWDDDREAYGELRMNLLGWLDGIVVQITYTESGDNIQVISLRKAEKHEIRKYQTAISFK